MALRMQFYQNRFLALLKPFSCFNKIVFLGMSREFCLPEPNLLKFRPFY